MPSIYTCDEVQAIRELHDYVFTGEFRSLSIRDQLNRQAERIVEAHQSGNPAVATHIKCWHPQLVGKTTDTIMSHPLTMEDAQETIAHEYGFANWADAQSNTLVPDVVFETAVDVLLAGEVEELKTMLAQHGGLARQRSNFGHEATLLHYVGSNGVETYRQIVPSNLAEVTKTLLAAGADKNATANIYGGGTTTLALLTSSAHPAAAGVVEEVAELFSDD